MWCEGCGQGGGSGAVAKEQAERERGRGIIHLATGIILTLVCALQVYADRYPTICAQYKVSYVTCVDCLMIFVWV